MNCRLTQIFLAITCTLFLIACNSSKPAQSANAKRYAFTGNVVAIDKPSTSLVVDAEEIPGFMSAMTMPYPVKDATVIDKVSVGDLIKAEVVVDGEKYWLENVSVSRHSTTPDSKSALKPDAALHIPIVSDQVPNFHFINQDGKHISLKQYSGKTLVITFIYTQCPFPDFCPRVTHEFAGLNNELHKDAALGSKTRLLSISIDPVRDTPKVLRAYGLASAGNKHPDLFNHWEFAVPTPKELPVVANYFGLTYKQDGAIITHSLSTTVIGPDGRIIKWYNGSDWRAADIMKDIVPVHVG